MQLTVLHEPTLKGIEMTQIFGILFTALFIFSTAQSASRIRVPRLLTTSSFKHPVMAQTSPVFVETRGSTTILRRFYITRWGTQRFEYGYANYQCKNSKCELMGDPTQITMFEKCRGFKSNGKPDCDRVVSSRIDIQDPNTGSRSGREWYACDDYGSPCRDSDELNEYPSREQNDRNEYGLSF